MGLRGTNMTTIAMKHWIPIAGRLTRAQSIHVPADLIVVCPWAVIGLTMTALVAASGSVGSAGLADILAVAE
jgi:hypothetical protein